MKLLVILFFLPAAAIAQVDSIEYYTKQAERFRFKQQDSIMVMASELYRYGKTSGDKKAIARSFIIKGISLDERGEYDVALNTYDTAYQLASASKDSSEMGRIEHHRGVVFKEKGQYDLALEHLTIAARLNTNPYMQSMIFMVMAGVFNLSNDFSSAKRYAWLAVRANDREDFSDGGAYVELGNSFFNTQQLDSAVFAYEKAKQFVNNETARDMLYTICNNLGVVYYYQGKLDKAIENFTMTYEASKKAKDKKSMAIGLMNIGDTYTAKGDLILAEQYLKESLIILNEIKHKALLRDAYDYLVNVQMKKNDWKQAFSYLKLNHSYKDSILNENSVSKIAEVQTKYETEKKEQVINTLEAEAKFQQQKIGAIIIFSLLIVVAVFLFYNQRTLRLKAQMAEEKKRVQQDRFRVVIDTEDKERKRIARELHDGLGQMLSTVRLLVSDMDETNTEPKVIRSLKVLDTTIEEVRIISHSMMPIQLIKSGITAALNGLVEMVNATKKFSIKLTIENDLILEEGISVAVYRAVQEIVNNSIKYSEASQISLSLTQEPKTLKVSVTDNGKGFDTKEISESKGIGWSNVYARMELIGGSVSIFSRQGEGTTVNLDIPLSEITSGIKIA